MPNLLVLVDANNAVDAIKLAPEVFAAERKLTINGQKFEDSNGGSSDFKITATRPNIVGPGFWVTIQLTHS